MRMASAAVAYALSISYLVGTMLTVASSGLDVVLPQRVTGIELGFVHVLCSVANNFSLAVTYRWTSSGGFQQTGQQLDMRHVASDQSGDYACSASADNGRLTGSGSVYVDIRFSPRWKYYMLNKYAAKLGQPAKIQCHVLANPAVSYLWQFGSLNITSDSRRRITSSREFSEVAFTTVQESDYGTYACHAVNIVDHVTFNVQLLRPGRPDMPQWCRLAAIAARSAYLYCRPGYDGGGDGLTYVIMKSDASMDPRDAASEWRDGGGGGLVNITVSQLIPNNSYTLLVYTQTDHGRSEEAFAVFVDTTYGGPAEPSGSTFVTKAAIIGGGVLCGVFGVIIIILIVVCIRRRKPREDSSRFTDKKKDVRSYIMEEGVGRGAPGRDSRRSWGSFRRSRPVQSAAGVPNAAYHATEAPPGGERAQRASVVDYHPSPARHSVVLHLAGGQVGESEVGCTNTAYVPPDAATVIPLDVIARRQQVDPVIRAQRIGRDQPNLAGHGALHQLMATPFMTPLVPSITPPATPPTGERPLSLMPTSDAPPQFVPEVPWEFPRAHLYIRVRLGVGSFGDVWRAKAEGILGRSGLIAVACKIIKEKHTNEERDEFVKELRIMKLLQPHPNIISLLGCCTDSEPLVIIMEFAVNGALEGLLRRQRTAFDSNDLSASIPRAARERNANLTSRDLVIFALHVASGMEYIASQKLLHRDLATRSVLIDETMICKLCDFITENDLIKLRREQANTLKLPIRWMSPESLSQDMYSSRSDAWAFGIIIWEIITLGSTPYPEMTCSQVIEFVQKGCRIAKPHHCSEALYAIMKDCWNHFPPKRPPFQMLCHRLTAVLNEPDINLYVDEMEENVFAVEQQPTNEKC